MFKPIQFVKTRSKSGIVVDDIDGVVTVRLKDGTTGEYLRDDLEPNLPDGKWYPANDIPKNALVLGVAMKVRDRDLRDFVKHRLQVVLCDQLVLLDVLVVEVPIVDVPAFDDVCARCNVPKMFDVAPFFNVAENTSSFRLEDEEGNYEDASKHILVYAAVLSPGELLEWYNYVVLAGRVVLAGSEAR